MSVSRVLVGLAVLVLTGSHAEAQATRCVVAVNVTPQKVEAVPPMRCRPEAKVKWVIANAADEDYVVMFDSFMVGSQPKRPTDQSAYSKEVGAGEDKKLDSGKIRPSQDFGGSDLPYTTYKYTIRLRKPGSNEDVYVLDPELEVVPPTILPGKK